VICWQGWSRLNNSGMPAPSCTVTVWGKGTNILSTIYSINSTAPSAAMPNPFTAGTDGSVAFYAPNGRYTVQFSGGGIVTPYALADVALYDPLTIGS
jgi:hypothetical protein